MFDSKSKRAQIEPSVYPEVSLNNKIPRRLMMGDSYSLLKHFPKYYNDLYLSLEDLNGAIQSKVKQLKLVRHLYGKKKGGSPYRKLHYEKKFKKLLQSSRKTLKSIPIVGGIDFPHNFALCMYFPKIKTLNLKQNLSVWRKSDPIRPISRSYGYFWSSSQFVENLELQCENDSDLFVIKRIERSARFLSHLKKVEIHMRWENEISTSILMELMKNKNFLRCLTHLVVENTWISTRDWIQSLLNACPQLCSLSFTIGCFRLDLSCLQKLQILKISVRHFNAFNSGIVLPPSVRRIDLKIVDHYGSDNFQESFDVQDIEYENMIEDQDARDWKSFEKYKMRNNFFEKWKKLNNLQVLNLTMCAFHRIDTLRDFVLPLLRAASQLKTFSLKTYFWGQRDPGAERSFDLGILFSGIETLKSLKHLTLSTDVFTHGVFSCSARPQNSLSLSNLSSVEIQTTLYSDFDLKKFFDGFLCLNNLQSELPVLNKNLALKHFCIFSVQDFIRILNIVHSVSHFQNFQLELTIYFIVESPSEIYSNFIYPISVAQNTQLRVNIYLRKFEEKDWTSEQEEDFKRVFGKLDFTVNEVEKSWWSDRGSRQLLPFGYEILRKNSKVKHDEKEHWKGPFTFFEKA